MIVNYFKVRNVEALNEAFDSLYRERMYDQNKVGPDVQHGDDKFVFLEYLHPRDDSWEMDFTLRSMSGPGYSLPRRHTRDFEMDPNGGFGEHTSAVLKDDHMAVQYNHNGTRASFVPKYVDEIVGLGGSSVKLTPVLDEGAVGRFRSSRKHTRITYAVYVDDSLGQQALRNLLPVEALSQSDANYVEITLALRHGPRGQSLSGDEIVESLVQRNRDSVDKLQAHIQNEDGKMETLNLLGQAYRSEIPIEGSFRRAPYHYRIGEIRREFNEWRNQILLNL